MGASGPVPRRSLFEVRGDRIMTGGPWMTDDSRNTAADVVDLEFYRVRRRAQNGVAVLTEGTEFFERVARALRGVSPSVALAADQDPTGHWLDAIELLRPAVVLVDAKLSRVDPAIAIGLLERRYPVPAILVGTFGRGGTTSLAVRRAFAAGAYDAVDWRIDPDALPSAVRVLLKMRNAKTR